MEVAQAAYTAAEKQGILTIISFPTTELSEEYFDAVAAIYADSRPSGEGFYSKRAGPILGYVSGSLDAGAAEELLRSIEYKYSVKWIFDKKNRGSRTVWGIPVPILGTVVRSLLFTALLCGISLVAGIAFATFRVLLRGYAPNNILDRPERTEIIRLKIDEN
jgi:hypothetical protein